MRVIGSQNPSLGLRIHHCNNLSFLKFVCILGTMSTLFGRFVRCIWLRYYQWSGIWTCSWVDPSSVMDQIPFLNQSINQWRKALTSHLGDPGSIPGQGHILCELSCALVLCCATRVFPDHPVFLPWLHFRSWLCSVVIMGWCGCQQKASLHACFSNTLQPHPSQFSF